MNSGTIIMIGCAVGVVIGIVWALKRKREIKKEAAKRSGRVEPKVGQADWNLLKGMHDGDD